MKTRIFASLLLLFCLAAVHASAAEDADTNAIAYVIQEKDETTRVLTEPARGRETYFTGPGTCVLATGETRIADDGQTWMEITRPALGWVLAENVGEQSPTCEAAFQVIDALYETLRFSGVRGCEPGEYTSLGEVPQISDWLRAHSAPVIEFTGISFEPPIVEKPLDQAMADILAMFEYLPAAHPDCSDVPREEFLDYFPVVITDEPDKFYLHLRENLRSQIRTIHFKITPEGPVISALDYEFML